MNPYFEPLQQVLFSFHCLPLYLLLLYWNSFLNYSDFQRSYTWFNNMYLIMQHNIRFVIELVTFQMKQNADIFET